MDGLSLSSFKSKLHKLNPSLKIQNTDIVYPHKDYPICGLYVGSGHKYLMAVPQHFVPKYSIAGVDMNLLITKGREQDARHLIDKGTNPKQIPEELLWRGYLAILTDLVRKGLVDRRKAEKEFGCTLLLNRIEYPKNYIQMEVDQY